MHVSYLSLGCNVTSAGLTRPDPGCTQGAPQPSNPGLHLDLRPHEVFEEEEVAERLVECPKHLDRGYFSDASFFGIKLFHESLGPVDI